MIDVVHMHEFSISFLLFGLLFAYYYRLWDLCLACVTCFSDALVIDACAIEEVGNNGVKDMKGLNDLDHIYVPDLDLSTSLDELVSQVVYDQDGLSLEDIKQIL